MGRGPRHPRGHGLGCQSPSQDSSFLLVKQNRLTARIEGFTMSANEWPMIVQFRITSRNLKGEIKQDEVAARGWDDAVDEWNKDNLHNDFDVFKIEIIG
jgi:hypothetical protein